MVTLGSQNGDFAEAVAALERAVILRRDYSNAKYFLGLAYYEVGRTDLAIPQFEDVQLLNPENTEVTQIIANLRAGRAPLQAAAPAPAPVEARR